jgi:hypothetical protein
MGGSFIPGKPTPPDMSCPTSPKACTSCKSKQGAAFIPFACKNYNFLGGGQLAAAIPSRKKLDEMLLSRNGRAVESLPALFFY